MTKPQIRIIHGDNVTDREMNDHEFAEYEAMQAKAKTQAKADEERAKLRIETLAKLGLTADEVAALFS